VCGIGLLGLARGPLALPRGSDPPPPPRIVDDPPSSAFGEASAPQLPEIRSPGSHRPGSSSARRRSARRRARRSLAMVATGLADLLLVGGAGIRRLRLGGRAAPNMGATGGPRSGAAQHT